MITGVANETLNLTLRGEIVSTIAETYNKAPQYNPDMLKVMGTDNEQFLMQTYYHDRGPAPPEEYQQRFDQIKSSSAFTNFLNE